jgi:hypothetical protein
MEQLSGLVDSASKMMSDAADDITTGVGRATDDITRGIGRMISNDKSETNDTNDPSETNDPSDDTVSQHISTTTKPTQQAETLPTYDVAVNTFYELKSLYEKRFADFKKNVRKKRVFGGKSEMTRRVGNYKPTCPKCKGVGGASFEMTDHNLYAECTASPKCNFKIHIKRTNVDQVEHLIKDCMDEERRKKELVIREKNRMIFNGHEPTEYETNLVDDVSWIISYKNELLVKKSNVLHGTPADRKEYEMLEDNYNQILGEIQKLKDVPEAERNYKEMVEIYKTRMVPTIESMRPLRKATLEHDISGMESDIASDSLGGSIDYSDRVIRYVMK